MKVKIDDYISSEWEKSLADFVASELARCDYESGLVEELGHTQSNVVRLLGVLIDLLVEKKILGSEDINDLLLTYKKFVIVEEN